MTRISLSVILLVAMVGMVGISCGDSAGNKAASAKPSPEVKKGIAPIADAEAVMIEMETPAYGTIKIELYSNLAPKHVARIKELAREGYYNGIGFHRINDTVIQAGDANTKAGGPQTQGKEGDSGKPNIQAEFSDVLYETGIFGAARLGNDVNSANAQFFIMLKREKAFDTSYTVYGKVVEGMNNVRTIAGAPTQGERPTEPVRIKSVSIVPR